MKQIFSKRTEYQEACKLAEYLRWKGYFSLHVPNEGKRSFAVAAMLKKSGALAGAPDYLIFDPVPSGYRGIAIELKRPIVEGEPPSKTAKVSDKQKSCLEKFARARWYTIVAYGADHAIQMLEDEIDGH